MSRKALLIGSPGTPNTQGYLKGVTKDLEYFDRFLKSPLGGFWQASEVISLLNPGAKQVQDQIDSMQAIDYTFVAFFGHGSYSSRLQTTIIELGSTELNEMDLRKGTNKRTILLDCCRVPRKEVLMEKRAFAALMDKAPMKLDPVECRKYFDKRIEEAPRGLVVLHACAVTETAGESELSGGYYSNALVSAAWNWLEVSNVDTRSSFRIMNVVQAHDDAVRKVATVSGGVQHPTIEKPRTEPYFPIAIIA